MFVCAGHIQAFLSHFFPSVFRHVVDGRVSRFVVLQSKSSAATEITRVVKFLLHDAIWFYSELSLRLHVALLDGRFSESNIQPRFDQPGCTTG